MPIFSWFFSSLHRTQAFSRSCCWPRLFTLRCSTSQPQLFSPTRLSKCTTVEERPGPVRLLKLFSVCDGITTAHRSPLFFSGRICSRQLLVHHGCLKHCAVNASGHSPYKECFCACIGGFCPVTSHLGHRITYSRQG